MIGFMLPNRSQQRVSGVRCILDIGVAEHSAEADDSHVRRSYSRDDGPAVVDIIGLPKATSRICIDPDRLFACDGWTTKSNSHEKQPCEWHNYGRAPRIQTAGTGLSGNSSIRIRTNPICSIDCLTSSARVSAFALLGFLPLGI